MPDQRLVRLTVDLTRPIPFAGFRVEGVIVRAGRTVSTTALTLVDQKGKPILTARALHVREQSSVDLPTTPWNPPELARSGPGVFPIRESRHPLPNFTGDGVAVRYPPGNGPGGGPTTAWMRTVPLLGDENPSPFQRICPLADCGNAFSRNGETDGVHVRQSRPHDRPAPRADRRLARLVVGVDDGSRRGSAWRTRCCSTSTAPSAARVQTLVITPLAR